eukprot:1150093-Pelagomonas_calceolata.AAC.3
MEARHVLNSTDLFPKCAALPLVCAFKAWAAKALHPLLHPSIFEPESAILNTAFMFHITLQRKLTANLRMDMHTPATSLHAHLCEQMSDVHACVLAPSIMHTFVCPRRCASKHDYRASSEAMLVFSQRTDIQPAPLSC